MILALQQVLTNNPTPLVWVLEHLSAVGWPAIVYFAWKVGGYFRQTSEQISKTVAQIDSMATNHTPHIQDGIHELVGLAKVNNDKLDSVIDVLRG